MEGAQKALTQLCALAAIVFAMTSASPNQQTVGVGLYADPTVSYMGAPNGRGGVYSATYRVGTPFVEFSLSPNQVPPSILPYCGLIGGFAEPVYVKLVNTLNNVVVASGHISQNQFLFWITTDVAQLSIDMHGSYRCEAVVRVSQSSPDRPMNMTNSYEVSSVDRYDLQVIAPVHIFRITIDTVLPHAVEFNVTCCASGAPSISLTIDGQVPTKMVNNGLHDATPSVCASVIEETSQEKTAQCTASLAAYTCSLPRLARFYCEDARSTLTVTQKYGANVDSSVFSRKIFSVPYYPDIPSTFDNCNATCVQKGYKRLSAIESQQDYNEIRQMLGDYWGLPPLYVPPAWLGMWIVQGNLMDCYNGKILQNYATHYTTPGRSAGPAGTINLLAQERGSKGGPVLLYHDYYAWVTFNYDSTKGTCVCERGKKPAPTK